MNAVNPLEQRNTHLHESTRGRRFFLSMACLLAALVFLGFAPSFYLRQFSSQPVLPGLLVVHGWVFSSWLLLLISQAALAHAGRVDLHRRLGIIGASLAAIMVPLGLWVAIDTAAHGSAGTRVDLPPLQFLIIPLGQILIFGGLVTAAIALRGNPAVHKRLIVIASINLVAPALARITRDILNIAGPLPVFAAMTILVGLCFAFDFATRSRIHPAFAIAGIASLLSFPARFAVSQTHAWLDFAGWLTQ
jgi:hypothetical protein